MMGKLYNGSIPIEQIFKFQQDAPLEDRVAVKTKEDLSLIHPYKGLLTYVEEERAYYSYTENEQGEYEWQKANLGLFLLLNRYSICMKIKNFLKIT